MIKTSPGTFPTSLCLVLLLVFTSSCTREVKIAQSTGHFANPTPTSSAFPTPIGHLNDYAGVLAPSGQAEISRLLDQFKQDTKVEAVIVIMKSTNGQSIFDYSLALAREWKVGTLGETGGGILLMVATDDHQWRIQVSKGLEKYLSDGVCKEIGDQMAKFFPKNDYAGGLATFISTTKEKLEAARSAQKSSTQH